MNPWSLYEHQPQLIQAGVIALGTWRFARRPPTPEGPARTAAIAALSWAALGVADYVVYAFGYQLAGLSMRETQPIQNALEWLRIVLVVIGVVALRRALSGDARSRSG